MKDKKTWKGKTEKAGKTGIKEGKERMKEGNE